MSYATDAADRLFKKMSRAIANPFNPFRICDYFDYTVLYRYMPESTLGQAIQSNREATIFLNHGLNEPTEQIVLFHELGHCRMHKDENTPFMRSMMIGGWIPQIEREANEFAVRYMMKQLEIDIYNPLTVPDVLQQLGLPDSFSRFIKL